MESGGRTVKKMMRKGMTFLLALALLLAACGIAAADGGDSLSGTAEATATFYVYANSSGYIKLMAQKGVAYVADYDFYGNFTGYKVEEDYGFFRVQVTGNNYAKAYIWAPAATMNTYSVELSRSLIITFPSYGDYKVTVTPMSRDEVNTYWTQNRFQYWMEFPSWEITTEVNCSCRDMSTSPADTGSSGGYNPPSGGSYVPASGTVTVYCYDDSGRYLNTYTETVTASGTLYPREISGYETTSSGQYIRYFSGICSPATLTFYYRIARSQPVYEPATVTVYCYDASGNYIRSYKETVTSSTTLYPRGIKGYTVNSSGRYITYSNGKANPDIITFSYRKADGSDVPAPATPTPVPPAPVTAPPAPPAPVSGTVAVTCYDSRGGVIRSYTETVTGTRTLYPPTFTGYTANSGAQNVTCENGVCNPARVDFYYTLNTAPAPSADARVVTPTVWDTQFKPGTATAVADGKIDNENKIEFLPRLYDNDYTTSFYWLYWQSERNDDIPELTAYFSGATVSSIGIRNGKVYGSSQYSRYGRVKRFVVRIYDTAGNMYSTTIQIPDRNTTDYQEFSLGGTYANVERIELWLDGIYKGSDEPYYIHISDIQFYQ